VITSFCKIFALGTVYVKNIFEEEVSVTEKLDGSQISMGVLNGQLHMRSKGAVLYEDHPNKMFAEGVAQIVGRYQQSRLPEGLVFHGEYLRVCKHNALTYGRVPLNHIALFSVSTASGDYFQYPVIAEWAKRLDFDVVPEIFRGKINSADEVLAMMDRESFLGMAQIEGLVVKNYFRPFLLGGAPMPLSAGKLVSEKFKEVHRDNWKSDNTVRGKWDYFKESYRTEARWHKAVMHLAEKGEIVYEPKDIGKLIKEIQMDITLEEKEIIMQMLWSEFGPELLRRATAGAAEWYKEWLLKRSEWPNAEAALEMGG